MCIRRETREKARRTLAFSPVSKPHTHITYMLRQYTSIAYLQEIPKDWKHSILIPIHKTGKNPSDPLSYRPISLTSNLNKIMKKMVNNRLQWYLEKHNLYNPNQSGFRKNRNTMAQCIRLENDIQKSLLTNILQLECL